VRAALEEAFAECGPIKAVRLPSDRETGEMKGIGYIEFATKQAKVGAPGVLDVHLPCRATWLLPSDRGTGEIKGIGLLGSPPKG
jgi:hypothetical protein